MAKKQATGSAKNLRDSNPNYRGVKAFGGQIVKAGNIVIRQLGSKYKLGENVYEGNDFTIHAAVDGTVEFSKKKAKRFDGRRYLRTFVSIKPNEKK